ncbi:ABC transporter substrate-binding protein [Blastococcus sp. SYSU D00820]
MSTSRRSSTRVGLALFAVSALALAGCSGSDSDSGTQQAAAEATGEPEVADITFGILPTPDYAPVQIAITEGFFEDEGLNVTTVVSNPGTVVPSLLSGDLDIAGVNWLGFVQAVSQDVPLLAVAESDLGSPGYAEIMVAADSPYQTLADLDGKTIGVVATPGNCDLIPLGHLAGEDSDAQPNFVNLPIPEMAGQISRGGVDAACVPEPTLSAMKASGEFRSVQDVFSGDYEGFPIVGFSMSRAFAEQNPNTVAALSRALENATSLAAENPDAVRAALKEFTEIPPEAIDAMVLPTYAEETDPGRIEQAVELLQQTGTNAEAELPDGSIYGQ